ncbi:hypothetical protein [Halococcus sp. PRR34]|uniref:hypothetical protein n=1 Tax=Halococcus sp. PRR34 TaxID=3020830 RepID=UPI002360EF12|nr:hypothetical protein [Halococcus sp. PRR34]
MSTGTADTDDVNVDTEPDEFVVEVNRILAEIDCLPYRIRRTGDETVTVLIGKGEGRVRGTFDREGYETRDSDVPVREGYAALIEVSR